MDERWSYGFHAVTAALRHQPQAIVELWLARDQRGPRSERLQEAARAAGISVRLVERARLDGLFGAAAHQGVAIRLAGHAPRAQGAVEVVEVARAAGASALIVVLDGVQDPRNLGACVRSAEGLGALGVVVPRDRTAGLTPAARKVASGAAERLPLWVVTNLVRTLEAVKREGLWVVGLGGRDDPPLDTLDLSGPVCLVVGAEGDGLRARTRQACDLLGGIPLAPDSESLNVAVAAGIGLFEIARQRRSTQHTR